MSETVVIVPRDNVNDETVTVTRWHVSNGGEVHAGEPLVDIETSKANVTIDAPVSGFVTSRFEQGNEVPVGGVIATISAIRIADQIEMSAVTTRDGTLRTGIGVTRFSPAARAAMLRQGLDPEQFAGRDFVRLSDIDPSVPQPRRRRTGFSPANDGPEPKRQAAGTFVRASASKRFEARALSETATQVVPSTVFRILAAGRVFVRVDQRLSVLRGTILPIVLFETARLLRKYPTLNATYEKDGYFSYSEPAVGLAVDQGNGLRVLRLRDESMNSITEIERAILTLIARYETNSLQQEDVAGMTFTVTDLSGEGASFFVPVINYGQSAILGIGAAEGPARSITFALTFDHRVCDGRTAARFLSELVERLSTFEGFADGSGEHTEETSPLACSRCLRTLDETVAFGGLGLFDLIGSGGERRLICSLCTRGF